MSAAPGSWPSLAVERLAGRSVDLERVDLARHGADLWAAIGSRRPLWDAIPSGPFTDEAAFALWLSERIDHPSTVMLAVIDRTAPHPAAAGLLFLLQSDLGFGRTEIGLVYGEPLTRRIGGTEAVYLLARHVFETCGYRRLEWRCRPDNAASRRAAERFGFTLEGVLRENLWVKGGPWDTAVYAMLSGEWAGVGPRIAVWLEGANFGADGRQIRRLAEI